MSRNKKISVRIPLPDQHNKFHSIPSEGRGYVARRNERQIIEEAMKEMEEQNNDEDSSGQDPHT
ncbi:MAG: hypothetical protein U1A23_03315 [Candidatus Sungbacteria bacterium]|nr:hypothetical protein [bacterium]MDZ4285931.1 hypothetical protein [Candidatus Sungbacteria bacterium]